VDTFLLFYLPFLSVVVFLAYKHKNVFNVFKWVIYTACMCGAAWCFGALMAHESFLKAILEMDLSNPKPLTELLEQNRMIIKNVMMFSLITGVVTVFADIITDFIKWDLKSQEREADKK